MPRDREESIPKEEMDRKAYCAIRFHTAVALISKKNFTQINLFFMGALEASG